MRARRTIAFLPALLLGCATSGTGVPLGAFDQFVSGVRITPEATLFPLSQPTYVTVISVVARHSTRLANAADDAALQLPAGDTIRLPTRHWNTQPVPTAQGGICRGRGEQVVSVGTMPVTSGRGGPRELRFYRCERMGSTTVVSGRTTSELLVLLTREPLPTAETDAILSEFNDAFTLSGLEASRELTGYLVAGRPRDTWAAYSIQVRW